MLEPEETRLLEHVLARQGLSLERLHDEAQAVVLFGSRAAGCSKPTSDWDLLCIGPGCSQKRDGLDLVWVSPQDLDTSAWLGGDLAGHVAAHGLWLKGESRWDLGAVDFAQAARRKQKRLERYLRGLGRAWDLLGPAYQRKHATLLRRDAQRWLLLEQRHPIPPSATLDARWTGADSGAWLSETLRSLGTEAKLATALVGCAAAPEPRWITASRGTRPDRRSLPA